MNMHQKVDDNREAYLEELFQVLRQRSISSQNIGIRECAELVAQKAREAGMPHVEIMETPDHPVVYAERLVSPDKPTVLIYGHYDVQPPDPIEEWISPPFEPTIRDGRIFARGAGDNKGQLMAQILAVKTYLEVEEELPVNLKFIFDGEEEITSKNLPSFVNEHKEKLKADLVYTSDGPMLPDGSPFLLLGVRGIQYVELRAKGSDFDNHSGNKGNIAQNPAWKLIDLLQTMRDRQGNVLIEGFHDNIVPPTEHELNLIRELPFDIEQIRKDIGDESLDMDQETYYRKLLFEPTFNIAGFTSGYGGEGAKTIIPSEAKVKLDMRLVANQEPEEILALLERHIEKYHPDIEVLNLGKMSPSKTPNDLELIETIHQTIQNSFGRKAYIKPCMGGSLPDYVWTKILGIPSLIVPYANADEANHSPNENLVVENFYNGIKCTCDVLTSIGQMKK